MTIDPIDSILNCTDFVSSVSDFKNILSKRTNSVYWGKMSMALARFDATMLEFGFHSNLKMIFSGEYLNQLMRNNDQRLLRDVLDILVVRDEQSRQTIQRFDFKESIESVLTLIDGSEITFQNFELMNVFLGIVNSILSASNTTLESSIPRLFKLIVDNTNATNILSEAIKTIRLIASTVADADSQHLIPFIVLLIDNLSSHQDDGDVPVITEVYQLLIEFNANHPTVISQLPQEIIVKSIDPDTWSHKLIDVNFPMQIHRLQWMLTYTIDNDILRRKVADIMGKKEVHQIFASGLKSSDEEMCTLTMELIRSPLFPLKSVSKILSGTFTPSVPNDERDCQPPVKTVKLNSEVDRLKSRTENSASTQSNEISKLKLTIRNCLNKISELESKLENSKLCADRMKTAYSTIKVKYDNVTKKLQDLTNEYNSLHNAIAAFVTAKTQQIAELSIQCEKDPDETHAATLAQLEKDLERETLELEERLAKGLKESYTRKEYTAKQSAMKKSFEQEKAELLNAHKKETQAALDKVENVEKELATKIDQVKENAQAITELTALLDEANIQVQHYKNLYELIKSLLIQK